MSAGAPNWAHIEASFPSLACTLSVRPAAVLFVLPFLTSYDGGSSSTTKYLASEVALPAPREITVMVVERRSMPRLHSARDLLRKLIWL